MIFFLLQCVVFVLVQGTNGRFSPLCQIPQLFIYFFSVLSIFSIVLHRQLQESKLWSTEVLLGKYFILRFFLSSLLGSNTEHVNFGVLFQVFSKLTWKQRLPKPDLEMHVKKHQTYVSHALYIPRYSIVLTTLKLMLKLKCYSAYY